MAKKITKKRASRSKKTKSPSYPKPLFHSPNIVHTAARGPIRRTAVTIGGGGAAGIAQSGGASQAVAQSPLFYDYRWSTPDKFYFPRNRVVANAIWREIYKRDPAVATATDMYAELPWSKFDLTGIEDGTVRKLYEDMFNTLNLVPKLQAFTRDYLITGELILHNIYNSSKGIWQRVISHNPDYIRVEGVGLAIEQPLLWLRPTPEIKKLINTDDPRFKKLRKAIPKEIINAFRANKEIALDSLNTTYIPKLNLSTDIRGMSLYTRLFRIIMYEDFIVNASLAVAQRNAAPLRIFKLGDPNSGWLPDEDDEAAFAEMLSMAEADPLAAIIMHHNVTCELVGVSDRVLLISREWDFIERVKLLALGVSKSFLIGETSLACFEKGTPVIKSDGTPTYIELIEEGDMVLDKNGTPRKVVKNWCEGVPEKLLEVTVWGGRKFRVTHNHRFPAWMWPTKGEHSMMPLPEGYEPDRIVEAQEFKKGDFLKIPRTYACEEHDTKRKVVLQNTVWRDDEFTYIPIHSVKEVSNKEPVFNLMVEGDHTYLICDGLATCNSAIAGLQTLMERLATLRLYFENEWMSKKICAPIAQIHEFYKRPKSEIDHRLRIKRHDEMELLVPKFRWHKVLESTQDPAILSAWRDLKERGLVSDRTYTTGAGVDLDTERKNITEEKKYKEEHPEIYGIPGQQPPGAPGARPPAGGKGLPVPPPPPPMPGASASMRKYGSDNPYIQSMQNRDTAEFLNTVEAEMDLYVDSENKIDIRDALEVVREAGEDGGKLNELEAREVRIPVAGSNLLTGVEG